MVTGLNTGQSMGATAEKRVLISDFKALLDKSRSDAAVFAVLTVVLTPVFVAAAVVALVFALGFVDLPFVDRLGFGRSFLTGVNLTVAFMLASYFLRPKPRWQRHDNDRIWEILALCLFAVLLALSYATPLAGTYASAFWLAYLFLTLAMLACIGHAYEPHDDYYLGWIAGPVIIDDPFTLEDDIDRAHIALGFVATISHTILDSYASIFGSKWLWRGFEYRQVAEAVKLLQAIAPNDHAGARTKLQNLSVDLVRPLVKMEMIILERGRIRLSLKGREFLMRKGSINR